jgi:hypothetical protein
VAKEGYVYFLATKNMFYVKVGRTVNLTSRVKTLAIQLPFEVDLLHAIRTDDPAWLESLIHSEWRSHRANGEWFCFSADELPLVERWKQINYWDRALQEKREADLELHLKAIDEKYPASSVTVEEAGACLNEIADAIWEAGL